MESIGFVQTQLNQFEKYIEEMVLLFCVDYCLIFGPSKDKIDGVYTSLQAISRYKMTDISKNILV